MLKVKSINVLMPKNLIFSFLILFYSCNQIQTEKKCNTFLECLDSTVWKITTGTFEQYNVFHNNSTGEFMTQYEMFNRSPVCKEFSFTIENVEQTLKEINGDLLSGKLRFIWNDNELYCTYVNNSRTENITFYKSSIEELKQSLKLRTGCTLN
jgi:hypothetical protein|tara:strand:- start:103 stop:561 length:459 start_codon:yes stop_codon:yes gene_type:complete